MYGPHMYGPRRISTSSEAGFSLVELLVVILIIGLLAAIAIPRFINQQNKARSAEAQTAIRTAALAMETYSQDKGSYAGADPGELEKIQPSLSDVHGRLGFDSLTPDRFKLHVDSTSNPPVRFFFDRRTSGLTVRTCDPSPEPGCPDGFWP